MTSIWVLIRDTAANWVDHKDARQGAALAYYSVFSLGPVMVIAVAIAGLVFGREPPAEKWRRNSPGCSVRLPPLPSMRC